MPYRHYVHRRLTARQRTPMLERTPAVAGVTAAGRGVGPVAGVGFASALLPRRPSPNNLAAGSARADTVPAAIPKVDFWQFEDGKAVAFFEYYDTAGLISGATA